MIEKILEYKYDCERDIRYIEKIIDTISNTTKDAIRIKHLLNKRSLCEATLDKINEQLALYHKNSDDKILLDLSYVLGILTPPREFNKKPTKAECKKNRKIHKGWDTSVMRTFGSDALPHRRANNDGSKKGEYIRTKGSVRAILTPMGGKRK